MLVSIAQHIFDSSLPLLASMYDGMSKYRQYIICYVLSFDMVYILNFSIMKNTRQS